MIAYGRRLILVCSIALAMPALPAAPVRAADVRDCGLSVLTGAPHATTDLARLRTSTAPADAYQLAQAYAAGTIVAQDCKAAAQLMSTAATAHVAAAENGLGELYRSGAGVAASDHDAAKWFRAAYNDGDPRGMFNFGRAVAQGKAFEYGQIAAVTTGSNFAGASVMHASSGADWSLVASIWSAAADKGDALAAYDLGKLLENGAEGVRIDRVRARQLYQLAADAGVPNAQQSLEAMNH